LVKMPFSFTMICFISKFTTKRKDNNKLEIPKQVKYCCNLSSRPYSSLGLQDQGTCWINFIKLMMCLPWPLVWPQILIFTNDYKRFKSWPGTVLAPTEKQKTNRYEYV
jgi:hypothetical protein